MREPASAAEDAPRYSRAATDAGPGTLRYANAMRFVGACCVVLIHAAPPTPGIPGQEAWVFYLLNSLARWSVPAFFLLSGALLLRPTRTESAVEFYSRRFWRVGVSVLFWTFAYWGFRVVALDESLRPSDMLRELAQGEPMYHLWFVYALMGLYLVTPLLRVVLANVPVRAQWTLAVGALAVASASVVCTAYLGVRRLPQVTDTWAYYLGYFVLGSVLRDVVPTRRLTAVAAGVFAVGVLVTATGRYFADLSARPMLWNGFVAGYLSPVAVVTSVAGYLAWAGVLTRPVFLGPLVSLLGTASFGMYLIHVMVLDSVKLLGWPEPDHEVLSALGLWGVVTVVSVTLAVGLARTPVLCRVVGAAGRG